MSFLPKIGVLGSGKGSNFRSILDAVRKGLVRAEIAVVVSDVEGSGILQIAKDAGLCTEVIHEEKYRTRLSPEVELELVEILKKYDVDVVVLAGFLRVLKSPMLSAFSSRILNIHPSLLPAFPGLAAWEQAVSAGVSESGCTVHLVDEGVDTGKILGQKTVPILPGDTAESLHARIQEAEHVLYPEVLAKFLAGA
jgi:phosphoribosylglycinamide formyltransferase-1